MGEHVVPHTIFDDPPEPDDVIIVTKHLLSSQSFAQEPFVFCPGARFRALPKEGPQTISGRVQFSARQQKEFMKTADVVKGAPWNLHRADQWLRGIVQANQAGFSPTWVPPTISWVVSGDPMSRPPVLPVPQVLPHATPVPVTMTDTSKKRIRCKQTAPNEVLAPAARRLKTSQRDQNLAVPSAEHGVDGAPLLQVNEAGAPPSVAAPCVQPAVPVAAPGTRKKKKSNHPARRGILTNQLRNRLLAITDEPSIGCGRCRQSPIGCGECRQRLCFWRQVHDRDVPPFVV